MVEQDVFDRLVSDLSPEERQGLLQRLSAQISSVQEPLRQNALETERLSADELYKKSPWYTRLVNFVIALFSGKTPVQVFGERLIARQGREIETQYPGVYDYSQGVLLQNFYDNLVALKEAARFFYGALDASVNKSRRAFYAFLGSLEMENLHERLLEESDPAAMTKLQPDVPETRLRLAALESAEEIFRSINVEERETMYKSVRSLHCLMALSSFLYDRILTAFRFDETLNTRICSAALVREQIAALNDIMFSMKAPPPLSLLGSLFMFMLRGQNIRRGPVFDLEIENLLHKAEKSIAVIRDFNRNIPLSVIISCAFRDLAKEPKDLSGGEDWFPVYQTYWRDMITEKFKAYILEKRRNDLREAYCDYFQNGQLEEIPILSSERVAEGSAQEESLGTIPASCEMALTFLLTFYRRVFLKELNPVLRPILIDGDFYRKENRREFTAAYNELIKLEDVIREFTAKISPEGEWGKQYEQISQDVLAMSIRQRKAQTLRAAVNEEAVRIIENARSALKSMLHVMGGISNRDSSGTDYDALTNAADIAGKSAAFFNGVTQIIKRLRETIHLLDDTSKIETRSDD